MNAPIPTTVPDLIAHLRRWADENAGHDGIGYLEMIDELLRIATERPAHIDRGRWGDLHCARCGVDNSSTLRMSDDAEWAALVAFVEAHRECKGCP